MSISAPDVPQEEELQFGEDASSEEKPKDRIIGKRDVKGRELTFYYPEPTQLVYYMGTLQTISSDMDRVSFMMHFLGSLLEDDDRNYLFSLLMNRGSGVTIEWIITTATEFAEEATKQDFT